jgi:hypothetical protein
MKQHVKKNRLRPACGNGKTSPIKVTVPPTARFVRDNAFTELLFWEDGWYEYKLEIHNLDAGTRALIQAKLNGGESVTIEQKPPCK